MKTLIFKIFLYLSLMFLLSFAATYLLNPRVKTIEKNEILRWHQFYNLPHNSTDILFLGSSHAYRSFNPNIVDSCTHLSSFNMGTPSQTPVTGYYVLKNVLLSQTPKTIVIENYFPLFYETDQLDNGSAVYDNLKDSALKKEFFKTSFNLYDKCALTFAPILRYKNNYTLFVKKLVGEGFVKEASSYVDKGYIEVEKKVGRQELQSINMFDDYVFDSSKLIPKNINYLKKTIELCKKKKIRIIVVTCPIPMTSYLKIKNPDAIDNYFKKLFASYHIEYYNYLNRISIGLDSDSMYFSDFHHLNNIGATIMSKKISAIINRTENYKLPV